MRFLTAALLALTLSIAAYAADDPAPRGFKETDIPASAVRIEKILPDAAHSNCKECGELGVRICLDAEHNYCTVNAATYTVTIDLRKTKLSLPKTGMDPYTLQELAAAAEYYAKHPVPRDKGTSTANIKHEPVMLAVSHRRGIEGEYARDCVQETRAATDHAPPAAGFPSQGYPINLHSTVKTTCVGGNCSATRVH